MSKTLLKFFLICLTLLISNPLISQKKTDKQYSFFCEIPLEKYISIASNSNYMIDLNEVTGLDFLDSDKLIWTNQRGSITTWDIVRNNLLSNGLIPHNFNKQVVFSSDKQTMISNTGSPKGHISFQRTLDYQSIEELNNEEDYLQNFALSPNEQLLITFKDNILVKWLLRRGKWEKKIIQLDKTPFSISFLDNNHILIGTNDGLIQIRDIDSFQIVNTIFAHNSTISNIAVKCNNSGFATTNGKLVKIFTSNGKSYKTLRTYSDFIGAITWLPDNKTLIIGSLNNGIEIWDTDLNKCLKTFNIDIRPKRLQPKRKQEVSGTSFIYTYNIDNDKRDSLKFWSKISAIGTNSNYIIATGHENLDVNTLSIKENELKLIKKRNIYEQGNGEQFWAIQSSETGDYVIEGNKYGYIGIELNDSKYYMAQVNHYSAFSQLDIFSFKDIIIGQLNSAMHKYKVASLYWIKKEPKERQKPSKLWDIIQKTLPKNVKRTPSGYFFGQDGITPIILTFPSGFDVSFSFSTKYLLGYDTLGSIKILNTSTLKLEIDTILPESIKKAYFITDNELLLINYAGEILRYNLKTKQINKVFNYAVSFNKVSYNQKSIVALADSSQIQLIDIDKKKSISKIDTYLNNYYIQDIEFIKGSNKLVWSANESTKETKSKIVTSLNIERYDRMIKKIAVSKDGSYFASGDDKGVIQIYRLTETKP